MSDKELLELAAKAGGIELIWSPATDLIVEFAIVKKQGGGFSIWNPLDDDGDALRLAVQLNIHVMRYEKMTTARPLFKTWGCDERVDGVSCAATRRAIVRAAAEIGRLMP